MANLQFRHEKIEKISKKDLQELQLNRLKAVVHRAYANEYYKKKLKASGVSPGDIQSLNDVNKLPFMTKKDFQVNFPYGLLTAEKSDLIRLHATSGTTGKPVSCFYTAKDLETWTELIARNLTCIGVTKDDIFQNTVTHGLFTGGLGYYQGATRLGCLYIPFGGGNTQRQIEFMNDYGVTAIHGIPSFGLKLVEVAQEMNVTVPLRIAMLGAELWSNGVRKKIEEGLECECYDNYGLTELTGPGVSCECPESKGDSLHVWSDNFLAEVINPTTGETLDFGEEGELVLTNLTKEGMPAIRYRTRDVVTLQEGCSCGRDAHVRMSRVKSRLDDMMKIRGVNVFPSQIEHIIMNHPEIGYNYIIRLWNRGVLDEITVEAEVRNDAFKNLTTEKEIVKKMEGLKKQISEELRNLILLRINVELKPEGAIPRSEGKAKRIFDDRIPI